MKVYVDFDRTLFDCDRFLIDFYKLISKYNIPKSIFRECQNQTKRHGFNPKIILDKIDEHFKFDKRLYQEIEMLIHKASKYLYEDAIYFLRYLKEKGYQVDILTRGNSLYQKEKIINSNLDGYYDNLIVTMRHKGKLNIDYHNSIFVDDNIKEIESILAREPLKIIYVMHDTNLEGVNYFDKNIFKVSSLTNIVEKRII